MKVDLHLHTFRSPDSLTRYDTVIDAVQRAGLDAIAVTDHNTIVGALELRERAPFPVIMGEEIRTSAGEIIGYFLEEEIPRGLPLVDSIDRVKAQGGLVSVPHPFDSVRRGSALGKETLMQIMDRVDLIEGFNSRCIRTADNRRAREIAAAHGKPITAGSDAHSAREIGNAYVEVSSFDGPASFLAAMQSAEWHGRRTSPLARFSSTWAKLVKRVRRPGL